MHHRSLGCCALTYAQGRILLCAYTFCTNLNGLYLALMELTLSLQAGDGRLPPDDMAQMAGIVRTLNPAHVATPEPGASQPGASLGNLSTPAIQALLSSLRMRGSAATPGGVASTPFVAGLHRTAPSLSNASPLPQSGDAMASACLGTVLLPATTEKEEAGTTMAADLKLPISSTSGRGLYRLSGGSATAEDKEVAIEKIVQPAPGTPGQLHLATPDAHNVLAELHKLCATATPSGTALTPFLAGLQRTSAHILPAKSWQAPQHMPSADIGAPTPPLAKNPDMQITPQPLALCPLNCSSSMAIESPQATGPWAALFDAASTPAAPLSKQSKNPYCSAVGSVPSSAFLSCLDFAGSADLALEVGGGGAWPTASAATPCSRRPGGSGDPKQEFAASMRGSLRSIDAAQTCRDNPCQQQCGFPASPPQQLNFPNAALAASGHTKLSSALAGGLPWSLAHLAGCPDECAESVASVSPGARQQHDALDTTSPACKQRNDGAKCWPKPTSQLSTAKAPRAASATSGIYCHAQVPSALLVMSSACSV